MIEFLSTWRSMGWQAALLFLFTFLALASALGVWLCTKFGRDDWGRYVPPEDLDAAHRTGRWSVGHDVKRL